MADNKFQFGKVLDKLNAMKSTLPVELAGQARRYFIDSFRNEAWDGKPWAVPKRRIEGTQEWKYPKYKGLGRRTQSTLVRTGQLKRAVNNSVRIATFERISLVVDVPYAGYLNNGTATMPARTFIRDSPTLERMQLEKIHTAIQKCFH